MFPFVKVYVTSICLFLGSIQRKFKCNDTEILDNLYGDFEMYFCKKDHVMNDGLDFRTISLHSFSIIFMFSFLFVVPILLMFTFLILVESVSLEQWSLLISFIKSLVSLLFFLYLNVQNIKRDANFFNERSH